MTGAGLNVSYAYDGFGRRVKQTVNGVVTYFLHDGDQVIEERGSGGVLQATYTYGSGIDEVLTMNRASQTFYYFHDGLGSVTDLTQSTGELVESYQYDVYGRPTTSSTVGNPYMFTGREYDSETGLYHYRARAYHPGIGRFMQRDPLTWGPNDPRAADLSNISPLFIVAMITGDKVPSSNMLVRHFILNQGLANGWLDHRYIYSFNNPMTFIDPFGFWGFGGVLSGTGEIGTGRKKEGAAGTVSGGSGIFMGGKGVSWGSFTSYGGFIGGSAGTGESAFGAFIGAGFGVFITNATSAVDLNRTIWTTSIDIGYILKISGQISQGDGVWIASVTFGPGAGFGTSTVQTATEGSTIFGDRGTTGIGGASGGSGGNRNKPPSENRVKK